MGFVCGYAKAMSEQEAVQDAATNLATSLKYLVDEIRTSDAEMTGEDTAQPKASDEDEIVGYPREP